MLTLGYELLTRRAELVALWSDDVTFLGDGTLPSPPVAASLTRLGRVALPSSSQIPPLSSRTGWTGAARRSNGSFAPIYQGKAINRDLSSTTVKRLIKPAARSAGLARDKASAFSGDSMRVCAAQDLLTMSYDTAAIMRAADENL